MSAPPKGAPWWVIIDDQAKMGPDGDALHARIAAATVQARAAGFQIVHIVMAHTPLNKPNPFGDTHVYTGERNVRRVLRDVGTTQIVEPGDICIAKANVSALSMHVRNWQRTRGFVQRHNPKQVVTCGFFANVCVIGNSYDFAKTLPDSDVRMMSDLTWGTLEEDPYDGGSRRLIKNFRQTTSAAVLG